MTGPGLSYRLEYAHATPSPEMVEQALEALKAQASPEAKAIFHHAVRTDDLAEIEALAARWKKHSSHLTVIGCGGSGLSGEALAMVKYGRSAQAELNVIDSLDSDLFLQQLQALDVTRSCFFIVSKSGETAESCAQGALLLDYLQRQGVADIPSRVQVMSASGSSRLRSMAALYGVPVMEHDAALCGRFSLLSAVGLVPAAFMGVDIRALRAGAAARLAAPLESAAEAAAWHVAQLRAGRNIAVLMPYSERLYGLGLWWRQAFAESLGKGGQGATPYLALGTADQHSQLQLFLDGPDDKYFTFLLPECEGKGPMLPQEACTLGDLQAAQQQGMVQALTRRGKVLRAVSVEAVDAHMFGALFMQLTLEIMGMAALLGVNAFDQPAVEESKQLAQAYLAQRCGLLPEKAAR